MTDGLHTVASTFGAKETMDRLETAARARGLTIFARIDHAAGAIAAGLSLRPTELLVFGDARVGTLLMQADQTMGIELPLKALVWQDAADRVWLSYVDPHAAVVRHALGSELEAIAGKMSSMLAALASQAAQ